MTSEERVHKFLSEPIRVEDFRTALVNLLNEHAAEARAEQREACGDKAFQYMDENTGVTWEVFIAGVQQAILNAMEKSDDE